MTGKLDMRGRPRVQTVNNEPDMCVQSDLKRSDIREILKKYKQVGIVDNLNAVQGQFVDISELEDYAQAMRLVKVAEGEFFKLPSKVREIFHHDVAEWLDAAHDPEKRDALVKAGWIVDPAAAAGGAPGGVEGSAEAGSALS